MGNSFGMQSTGQLLIDLIVTEDQVHVKVTGTGVLHEITKYFSKEREQRDYNDEDRNIIVEQYKFAINVEVEDNEDQDNINLVLRDTDNSDTTSDSQSDSDSDSNNDTYYNTTSDKENTPEN